MECDSHWKRKRSPEPCYWWNRKVSGSEPSSAPRGISENRMRQQRWFWQKFWGPREREWNNNGFTPVSCLVAQLCPTLCDPVDCSSPGSSSLGFPRQEYWSGSPFPCDGIFLTQGLNLGPLHCRQFLYHRSHQQSLKGLKGPKGAPKIQRQEGTLGLLGLGRTESTSIPNRLSGLGLDLLRPLDLNIRMVAYLISCLQVNTLRAIKIQSCGIYNTL